MRSEPYLPSGNPVERPIKVLFDQQIFLLQKFGGISRYFTELIKTFHEHPELGVIPVVEKKNTYNAHLSEELSHLGFFAGHSKASRMVEILAGATIFRNQDIKADLVHLTFYLPGYFGRNRALPKVVTLHDMIPEKSFSRRRLWNPHFNKRENIVRADAVVSVSKASTADMKHQFGIDRHIPTTYLGVSPRFSANLVKLSQLPSRYFLYVGSRKGYKDSHTALNAFARVCEKHADINLVFLGGGRFSSEEHRHLKSLGISEKVTQWDVSDEDLPRAYSNAIALLYPSIHEGFGLPLVEAMSSEIPVIASDTAINREIAGGAGAFFPVGNSSEMADLMKTVLTEPNAQMTKIRIGLELSKKFSWLECAKQTAEVYKGLIQGSRAPSL